MKPENANKYYVALTGSKNNAGDYLIKKRAFLLFNSIRPEIKVYDLNGWEKLDGTKLELINNSACLILLGGPALQERMRPNVYALTPNLSSISVPIVTMGVGWHSTRGDWSHTKNYPLNSPTIELLERIESSGLKSSVRDFHTLNVLSSKGYQNFIMTGCPALYSSEHFNQALPGLRKPRRIAFSLGVSLKGSNRMFRQMQECVLTLRNFYGEDVHLEVVFHHSLDDSYLKAHGAATLLHNRQREFAKWLESISIPAIDISGSAEKLINYYSEIDFHIGYRVHAHIFMCSISKPSLLLSEDGRGVALKEVLGGLNLKAFKRCRSNRLISLLQKINIPFDDFVALEKLSQDLIMMIRSEEDHPLKLLEPRERINRTYPRMKEFLCQLP